MRNKFTCKNQKKLRGEYDARTRLYRLLEGAVPAPTLRDHATGRSTPTKVEHLLIYQAAGLSLEGWLRSPEHGSREERRAARSAKEQLDRDVRIVHAERERLGWKEAEEERARQERRARRAAIGSSL